MIRQPLRLHEEVRERRMRTVAVDRADHHFGVAGELDLAVLARAVGDDHATHFGAVVRHDRDLGRRLEVFVLAVKHDAIEREHGAIRVGRLAERLMRGRPGAAARQVADVAELAEMVSRRIVAPACDGETGGARVATAGRGHHDRVGRVPQERDARLRRMWRVELPHGRPLRLALRPHAFDLRLLRILPHEPARDPLEEQQLRRAYQRIPVKAPLPAHLRQHVRE